MKQIISQATQIIEQKGQGNVRGNGGIGGHARQSEGRQAFQTFIGHAPGFALIVYQRQYRLGERLGLSAALVMEGLNAPLEA